MWYIILLATDGVFMRREEIQRAAMLLNLKYGKRALTRAIDTARFYVESNDNDSAKRWISIGYEIKKIQGLVTDSDIDGKIAS